MNNLELSADQCWKFKFIVVGDQSVGKSCLTRRYGDGNFNQEIKSTIGVEFVRKFVNLPGQMLELQIWDTVLIQQSKAGQEQFRSMVPNFYRGSAAVFLVYNVNQRDSFDQLTKWIKDIEEKTHEEIIKVLVGNKCDLPKVIETQEGQKFIEQYSFKFFFETSAKTGQCVEEAFTTAAQLVLERCQQSKSFLNATKITQKPSQMQVKIEQTKSTEQSSCC